MKYINTYENRVAEFEKQQKYLNSKAKPAEPVSKEAIDAGIPATLDKRFVKNPYEIARDKTLLDMPEFRRKEILSMEKRGDTNNARYNEFTARVAKLGDSLSNA
jgi:hypothetical protein